MADDQKSTPTQPQTTTVTTSTSPTASAPGGTKTEQQPATALPREPDAPTYPCPRCGQPLLVEVGGTGLCRPCGGRRYDLASLPTGNEEARP